MMDKLQEIIHSKLNKIKIELDNPSNCMYNWDKNTKNMCISTSNAWFNGLIV